MRKNILIEFSPKTTYKDWIFNNAEPIEYFSQKQIEDKINIILEKIPSKLLDKYEEIGWKIIITNKRNIEENYGYTYKVYGCTDYEKKEAIVYADKFGIESIPHEMAHFLDSLINITTLHEWYNVYVNERRFYESNQLKNYFTGSNSKEECFADAFLLYVLNKDLLKVNARETYDIIDKIFKYIDYLI